MDTATFQRVAVSKLTVTLSGDRRYSISPGDVSKAVVWLPGTKVEIEEADDPIYPVTIRRELYPHDELRARPLSESSRPRS